MRLFPANGHVLPNHCNRASAEPSTDMLAKSYAISFELFWHCTDIHVLSRQTRDFAR
jgi:hypothetical protein